MKKTGFIFLKDNIVCPICLEVFRNPVTTACGHNFCMDCLQDYWDHQVLIGECPYCPQCREPFSSRPQLRKNITLGEIAMRFAREEAQGSRKLAGSRDVPCDFCSPRKLKAVKSCLQCMAALCDNHIRSHYEDKTFKNHQLIDPISDLKANICLKHRKLLELFCKMEGKFICQICIREEHKNHEAVSLKEERIKKEVEVRQIHANVGNQIFMLVADSQKHRGRVNYLAKVVKTARDEVNRAFAEVFKEVKRLQTKVTDFIDQEERSALVGMGNSIQYRQEQLDNLRKQNLWLATLIDEPSDHQFLMDIPKIKMMSGCTETLTGLKCEEPTSFVGLKQTLTDLKSQISMIGLCFINKVLQKGITMVPYEVIPAPTDRKNLLRYYCTLNFDASTANEELFLFKETHSVLNMGILLENYSKPSQGFNHWPQLLCTRSLCEGCHYWEAEISNTWLCLGVTYSYRHRTEKSCMLYLIGRNSNSWCLEWDSVKFSVWHNNIQTVVQGNYYKTIGVLLDYAAGSLTFYGITNTMNLIYRFLSTFTEPLYPAAMVSSGASVTLKQHPE
ncbi:E3 ubiquitin/ISG15 ligase TRIM25-like isoform X1 [Sceloporus undulatus]|uniref:E3 ubiquitin/ISG15 ligase TRIM25-like isoform X1 n=1 Tax=Sceloporus undulatus TaxID=8520 RepID=UPI001C4B19B9|nr:E3 ubiquitin/ISG15 ligase TRIM25-like isoform X1 [Sceloporus undulatus]XP_042306861.1 E3 ubiquitin/ISG15 ligase TRIM25-like isoform X1 [Sceloporus undulatus]